MVAEGKRDPEEVTQEEQEKKHQEMLKKANEQKQKQAEQDAKLEQERKKKEDELANVTHFDPISPKSAQLIDQMHVLIAKFERSQQLADYQQAKDVYHDLRTNYNVNSEAIQTNLDVTSLVKQGFSEFPEISQNDYAVDQILQITAAQDNLNNNVENMNLAQAFIDKVQSTSGKLEAQYKDYWHNPFANQAKQLNQKETVVAAEDS